MLNSYPWYIVDWLQSETRHRLNPAQRGIYRDLLDYCYLEGSLPSDPEQLRSILGATRQQLRYNLKAILELFVLIGERYHHRKVDEVRAKLLIIKDQQKQKGMLSGKSRRNRGSTAVEPIPIPYTSPSTSSERNTLSEERVRDPEFGAFTADYLATGGAFIEEDFVAAFPVWKRLAFTQRMERMTALKGHAAVWTDPRFIPKPKKFLETEWKRPPVARIDTKRESYADSVKRTIGRRIANGEQPW